MNKQEPLRYEVNFLTEELAISHNNIREIKKEFDFIRMCQGMIRPFGIDARETLGCFIALSLRKLLCDKQSIIRTLCPEFKMPPITGDILIIPGDNNDLKLHETYISLKIKPQTEWIPLDEWLEQRIAWIEKTADDIPDAYEDVFFTMIVRHTGDPSIKKYFFSEEIESNGKKKIIWKFIDNKDKEAIFTLLKEKGYYDLTVRRMIKHIADREGAHIDHRGSSWIKMTNNGDDWNRTAISNFATHMIYAATKQIGGLKDYYEINPMLETQQIEQDIIICKD